MKLKLNMELLFKEEVYEIVGAAIEVHKNMGIGFIEAVYQECLEVELKNRDIPYDSQRQVQIHYKDKLINKYYIPDLVCYGEIVVELKAIEQLTGREEAQIINYLRATKYRIGVLINFGSKTKLEWRRLIV